MKPLRFSLAIILAAGLSANAQTTATTDPVGFVSYTVKANSDQALGVPMQQASIFQGTATTVSGTSVAASGITSLSGANFLVVTSGTANGKWEQIASSSTGSLTLSASISGFANGDTFAIKPFWTLSQLLPGGGGLPASSDPTDPVAVVYLNNPAAVGVNLAATRPFAYSDGSGDYPVGWWTTAGQSADSTTIEPDVFLTARNQTATAATLTFVGSVPTSKFALDVVSRAAGQQDNQLYNKWPADTTLGASGLSQSGAVAPSDPESPGDVVLIYPLGSSGLNKVPTVQYCYTDGSAESGYAAGWYNTTSLAESSTTLIPAGAALVIRKSAGANATIPWNPNVPYALQ